MSKFFIGVAVPDQTYDTQEAAIEAAKMKSHELPGQTILVAQELDTVVTPLPEPVVTPVE